MLTVLLDYADQMMFNWTKIAAMLGVSRTTIYRCRIELGLSTSVDESNITDDQLDSILSEEKLLLLDKYWPLER